MDANQELKLIRSAKQDLHAFAQLYDHYFPIIYSYTLNRCANREMAEDVTSSVFIKMIKEVKEFDENKSKTLKPLLFRMAHNLLIDQQRNLSHQSNLNEQVHTQTPDLDKPIIINTLQEKIQKIMSQLNERYQQILSLKYYAELSTEEIAEVMDLNKNNVYVLLTRAHEAFRNKIMENDPESEIFNLLQSY
jgi:RNA polymerase sigma-70 factor (ECF subfamily)